jgi:hypothetical protein
MANGAPIDPLALGAVNGASLLVFAIALSLQLPFFFSVGFTRARLVTFVPGVILVGGAAIASQTGLLTVSTVASTLSQNLSTLWVVAPIVAVVVLLLSIGISTARYGRRGF